MHWKTRTTHSFTPSARPYTSPFTGPYIRLSLSFDRGVVFRRHRGVPALYSNRRGSRGASGVRSNPRPSFPVARDTIYAIMSSV